VNDDLESLRRELDRAYDAQRATEDSILAERQRTQELAAALAESRTAAPVPRA